MKLNAGSIDEYFTKSEKNEQDLRKLDKLITDTVPELERYLFNGMSMSMVSYGSYHYKYSSGKEGDWPIIALAKQKNHLSMYVSAVRDGKYLPEIYSDRLGKVSCGKSCIRFKSINDLDLPAVKDLISEAAELHKQGNAGL